MQSPLLSRLFRIPAIVGAEFWKQHPDLLAVRHVALTKERDEVPFLEPNTDKNVGRAGRGEQEMTCRHIRRRPEGENEAQVDRVPHMAVKQRCVEHGRW